VTIHIRKFKISVPRHLDWNSYIDTLQELACETFMDETDVEQASMLEVNGNMEVCSYTITRIE
jgi:hypothetical protein